MTIAPFDTLLMLISQLRDLDMAQEWIDEVRLATPTNQVTQSNMDRQQLAIDAKRELIILTMNEISSRN